mmetsp:Transcript_12254/g.24201  ORF Transcript_12254/g.24201 Transcript_12254/m.24201 type:complete len:232 (-) Transcript_12254:204-899(-)
MLRQRNFGRGGHTHGAVDEPEAHGRAQDAPDPDPRRRPRALGAADDAEGAAEHSAPRARHLPLLRPLPKRPPGDAERRLGHSEEDERQPQCERYQGGDDEPRRSEEAGGEPLHLVLPVWAQRLPHLIVRHVLFRHGIPQLLLLRGRDLLEVKDVAGRLGLPIPLPHKLIPAGRAQSLAVPLQEELVSPVHALERHLRILCVVQLHRGLVRAPQDHLVVVVLPRRLHREAAA